MSPEQKASLLEAIQRAADKAAEKQVEIKVEVCSFSFDGRFEATITAKPHAQS